MQKRTQRILTSKEVKALKARLAKLDTYLTPSQAVARLDAHFTFIQDSIHSGYECIPEYPPIWENGLLDCIESSRVPSFGGSKHYDPAKIDQWFFDCYSPSIMCNPRAA